ncbi:hypothetical protein D3C84_1199400 [compost metagenome]
MSKLLRTLLQEKLFHYRRFRCGLYIAKFLSLALWRHQWLVELARGRDLASHAVHALLDGKFQIDTTGSFLAQRKRLLRH